MLAPLCSSYRFASGLVATMAVSFGVTKRRFEVTATGSAGGVLLERGVHEGRHGYHVTYEPHATGVGAVPLAEFYPFDGIPAAVGLFGAALGRRMRGEAPAGDRRLDPRAAVVDIELVDRVMQGDAREARP